MRRGLGDPRAAAVVRLPPDEATIVAAELALTISPGTRRGEARTDPMGQVAEAIVWDPERWPTGQVGDLTVHDFLTDLNALATVLRARDRETGTLLQTGAEPTRDHYERALAVLISGTAADDPVLATVARYRRASTHPFHGRVSAKQWREDLEGRAPQVRPAWRALKDAVGEDPRLTT